MAETMSFPPIEPTTFNLIVVGTGLPESVIAAAASTAGKTVLHLDPNHFYGGHFSSLPLHDLTSFLHANSQNPNPNNPHRPYSDVSDDFSSSIINLTTRPLYSAVEILSLSSEPLDEQHFRKFNIDLAGPRVLFCADSAVELMLKSNATQYTEFKNIEASLICDENGNLRNVPDSRSAIFKDKTLAWSEKNQLMSFFKLVQGHFQAESNEKISKEDLESPFAEFLNKMRLPSKIKSIILYAIAMADYDQDNGEVYKDVLKTKDGMNRLALYNSSIGRFPNAFGALIYPIYGQGELPQAFCRRAAVKGCLYVLRMPVIDLLVDKGSESYKGVRLASGQELFSQKLVLDPSFTVPSPTSNSSSDFLEDSHLVFGPRDVSRKVARGICITKSPLKPDVSSCLVIFPPRSLYPEQVASVRVLQIASSLAVCPSGMFVFYLSALCEDVTQGKKLLNAALNALFSVPFSGGPESISTEQTENTAEAKPTLVWGALYIQDLTVGSFGSVSSTPMPDGNLTYNDVLHATVELYEKMYPSEDFFPETTSSDKPEVDGGDIDTVSL